MELYRAVSGKRLRCGYTTGSCAAGAAKAAAEMLLSGHMANTVTLNTPKGIPLTLDVEEPRLDADTASCAVRKDSGDDPDATHGILIFAKVSRRETGIVIRGGEGVGRVTKPGLDQPVGEAAINSVPRAMICQEAEEVCRQFGYTGGLTITISVPGGEALAKSTFNPRMGIEGGISILGTTGIVEPMSHRALADAIRLEIRQLAAQGERAIVLTPGNYGETFAARHLGLDLRCHVNCSNFLGEALDACVEHGLKQILLVGHIGKLVKLGIGLLNTHSAFGDGRMETLIACALEAGADTPLLQSLLSCATTDAALALLREAGILDPTMAILGRRIQETLLRRVPADVTVDHICFTNEGNRVLCQSKHAEEQRRLWRQPV